MRARVYFNLHKLMWSVQLKNPRTKNWYVAFHAREVRLEDVQWKVSQAGRERVIRERRKNVHAYAVGTLAGMWGATVARDIRNVEVAREFADTTRPETQNWGTVGYNPYKYAAFQMDGDNLFDSSHGYLFLDGLSPRVRAA